MVRELSILMCVAAVLTGAEAGRARPADDRLARRVNAKIHDELVVDQTSIRVGAADGVVTLTGAVGSSQARDAAMAAARSVPGVRAVIPQLRIARTYWRTDAAIRRDLAWSFTHDPVLAGSALRAEVQGMRVTLDGTVASRAQMRRARSLAYQAGAREVFTNSVAVRPESLAGARPPASAPPRAWRVPLPSDVELEDRLSAELRRTPRLSDNELDIQVDDGVVTLRGQVDGALDRGLAVRIARSFRGVVSVKNELQIATTRLPTAAERARAPSEDDDPAGDANPSNSGSNSRYNAR